MSYSKRSTFVILAGCLLFLACDLPTEAPIVEQTWAVPLPEISVTAADVAPTFLVPVPSGFDVALDPVVAASNLGTLCGAACDTLNGLVAPVPAFTGIVGSNFDLPADLIVAYVRSGVIDVSVTNNMGFDPTENGGTVSLEVVGPTGMVVASTTFDASQGFPTGSSLQTTLLLGSLDFDGDVRTVIDVPGGQTSLIDSAADLSVSASFTSFTVTGGQLGSLDETFIFGPEAFEIDLGDQILENVQGGFVEFKIANPWGATVSGSLDFGPVSKPILIQTAASSTVRLDFSESELREMLRPTSVSLTGVGTASGTSIEIDASDLLSLKPTFFFVIRP